MLVGIPVGLVVVVEQGGAVEKELAEILTYVPGSCVVGLLLTSDFANS